MFAVPKTHISEAAQDAGKEHTDAVKKQIADNFIEALATLTWKAQNDVLALVSAHYEQEREQYIKNLENNLRAAKKYKKFNIPFL